MIAFFRKLDALCKLDTRPQASLRAHGRAQLLPPEGWEVLRTRTGVRGQA
jgi:hypothetical protein